MKNKHIINLPCSFSVLSNSISLGTGEVFETENPGNPTVKFQEVIGHRF